DVTDRTVAEQLLATGRVMPVLDGFDEITSGLRADAIVGINAALRTGDQLLLTSRPAEYAAAVKAGDVLTSAAVVMLTDLTGKEVRSYLPLTTRKAGDGTVGTKWDPVLKRSYDSAGATELAEVLSTPLMVALARAIFSDTDADPAELLELTSATELEDRLLAGFIPAVYSRVHHSSQPCSAADAHHYLGFLANHLRKLGTYDLAWWQLVAATPRILVGLASGLMIAFMVLFGTWTLGLLGTWTNNGHTAWLVAGVVVAVMCGAAGGSIIGVGLRVRPSPARIRLRIDSSQLVRVRHDLALGFRSWRTMIWFLAWSGSGAAFGLVATRLLNSQNAVAAGLAAGLIAGTGIWLVITVVRALGRPVDPTDTISPAELMNTDRTTALHQGLIIGIGSATVMWLVISIAFEPAFGLPLEAVFPNGIWLL
ncbi:MAG: XRE family transcriptional regulator, partial [Gammaproteobacteria bacterium]